VGRTNVIVLFTLMVLAISLSMTTSLKSTVTRYVQENGRRYHAPREDGGVIDYMHSLSSVHLTNTSSLLSA
jgi:hypothetical protein